MPDTTTPRGDALPPAPAAWPPHVAELAAAVHTPEACAFVDTEGQRWACVPFAVSNALMLAQLTGRLGLPPDARLVGAVLWGAHLPRYLFQFFGLPADSQDAARDTVVYWPIENHAPLCLDVRLARAYPAGCPLYAEWWWHPTWGVDGGVLGALEPHPQKAYGPADLGLRHLTRLVSHRGKHAGDGAFYTDAEFPGRLDKAIREVQRTTGRSLADPRSVMRRLQLRKTAFYDYIGRTCEGLHWREIRANYAELNGKRLVDNVEGPAER